MAEEIKRTLADRGHRPARPANSPATPPRKFPEFEKAFDRGELPAVMQDIEKTCRALDEQSRSADPAVQERARAALTAYGRTLELVRELGQLRESMASGGNK